MVVGRGVMSTFPLSKMSHSPETKGSCLLEEDLVERLDLAGRFDLADFRFIITPNLETLRGLDVQARLACPRFSL